MEQNNTSKYVKMITLFIIESSNPAVTKTCFGKTFLLISNQYVKSLIRNRVLQEIARIQF